MAICLRLCELDVRCPDLFVDDDDDTIAVRLLIIVKPEQSSVDRPNKQFIINFAYSVCATPYQNQNQN